MDAYTNEETVTFTNDDRKMLACVALAQFVIVMVHTAFFREVSLGLLMLIAAGTLLPYAMKCRQVSKVLAGACTTLLLVPALSLFAPYAFDLMVQIYSQI